MNPNSFLFLFQGQSLESDMENFLKNENGNEFADVFIILNDGNSLQQPPLLAHMCILAARCAYFEAHFRSFLPKDRKVVVKKILLLKIIIL